jgi:hypothetical protein
VPATRRKRERERENRFATEMRTQESKVSHLPLATMTEGDAARNASVRKLAGNVEVSKGSPMSETGRATSQ